MKVIEALINKGLCISIHNLVTLESELQFQFRMKNVQLMIIAPFSGMLFYLVFKEFVIKLLKATSLVLYNQLTIESSENGFCLLNTNFWGFYDIFQCDPGIAD